MVRSDIKSLFYFALSHKCTPNRNASQGVPNSLPVMCNHAHGTPKSAL